MTRPKSQHHLVARTTAHELPRNGFLQRQGRPDGRPCHAFAPATQPAQEAARHGAGAPYLLLPVAAQRPDPLQRLPQVHQHRPAERFHRKAHSRAPHLVPLRYRHPRRRQERARRCRHRLLRREVDRRCQGILRPQDQGPGEEPEGPGGNCHGQEQQPASYRGRSETEGPRPTAGASRWRCTDCSRGVVSRPQQFLWDAKNKVNLYSLHCNVRSEIPGRQIRFPRSLPPMPKTFPHHRPTSPGRRPPLPSPSPLETSPPSVFPW